jgi:protein-S-isoprenylcysteine O-methyltransferase Ste14
MRRSNAAIASAAFFVVAPGTVVGLIPWLITRWEIPDSTPVWQIIIGVLLIVAGLIPPIHAFSQFVKAGGTPMPIAPTQRLVVTGFNRYVRNPMYLGLLVAMAGEAVLFGSVAVLIVGRGVLDPHRIVCPLVRRAHPGPRIRPRI